ncbi:N-acetyltransferase [Lampropedia puyangensis]|uniref:N-acetyltransferase n=1 Tax=Lampropedia puyangensis TaxID=1330072 RepID=A0A4S8EQC9_9BURK|nr:N-acetyltransferase [Lampropedia puyangensis]THT96418.1 N-acetyltransferase [Lampropedia puyangensis]
MIRPFSTADMDAVLDVWLCASIKAHSFIASDFWHSHLESMRTTYLPGSEAWVHEKNGQVSAFIALQGNRLAAIFVSPVLQGSGIGKSLISQAKSLRDHLNLTVYTANSASVRFYKSQGFMIVSEDMDAATNEPELTMSWVNSHSTSNALPSIGA